MRRGFGLVWSSSASVSSAPSLCDRPAPAPVPKPWEQESSATALLTHSRGVPGLFDSLGVLFLAGPENHMDRNCFLPI